jgi:RNA polymerase sigma factor (sigma-70 family)
MTEDQTLLRHYTTQGSREALDGLIRRHMNLVYSSALRQVRDPNLAEDVTQAVFLILVQKARSIRDGVAVGGWLLAVTRRAAVQAMKKRTSDGRHDKAMAKPELAAAQAVAWEQVAPVLDEALGGLAPGDRDAIVLRVLENQSLNGVGRALGISEGAAGKRVERALARLRKVLTRRGVTVPAAALSATLAAHGVEAAPARLLRATLRTTATGTASAAVAAIVQGTLSAMAWGGAPITAAVALGILLLGGVVFGVAMRREPAAPANAATFPAPEAVVPSIFADEAWLVSPGQGNPSVKLATDAAGDLYAFGSIYDEDNKEHGMVRRKASGQAAWETLFDSTTAVYVSGLASGPAGDLYIAVHGPAQWEVYRRPAGQIAFPEQPMEGFFANRFGGLTVDDAGNVYVAYNNVRHWILRKQTGAQGPFTTVEDFIGNGDPENPSLDSLSRRPLVVRDGPSAGVYLVGYTNQMTPGTDGNDAISRPHWMVRKSRDEGQTWTTVDDFAGGRTSVNIVYEACTDARGVIYATGFAAYPGCHWITRRSVTGEPGTWVTDDDFVAHKNESYMGQVLAADAAGNVYAAGYSGAPAGGTNDRNAPKYGVIRTNSGGAWHTIDEFHLPSNQVSWTGLAVDGAGTLYVACSAVQGDTRGWLVRSATAEALRKAGSGSVLLNAAR